MPFDVSRRGGNQLQDAIGIGAEFLARRGNLNTAASPVEELDAQRIFHAGDMLADCGLRDAQRFRRGGKALVIANGENRV